MITLQWNRILNKGTNLPSYFVLYVFHVSEGYNIMIFTSALIAT